MKAQFIVIEGLEGAGKSSAIRFLQATLQDLAILHILTREPGGTPIAELLRGLIKSGHKQEKLTPKAELLLLYAARSQLVDRVIQPALASGQWVIGDRHALSTYAYQGGGRQLPLPMIDTIHQLTLADFTPDLTLYLDIEPKIGLQRIQQRGQLDHIEQEDIAFFTRTRKQYLLMAEKDERIEAIDASQTIEQVQQTIMAVLVKHYPTLKSRRA